MNKTCLKFTSLFLIMSMLLTGCGGSEKAPVKQPELLTPVNVVDKTETVAYRDVFDSLIYNACIVPESEELSFTSDGIFDQFYVAVGDHVTKGQKLASQNNEEIEQQLNDMQTSYDDLQETYTSSKKLNDMDLEIIETKLEKDKGLLKDAKEEAKKEIQYDIDKLELDKKDLVDSSALQYKSFESQLALLKSHIDLTNAKLASNVIVAPFDGIVANLGNYEQGGAANANYTVLTLYNPAVTYLKCDPYVLYNLNQADKYYAYFNGKDYEIEYNGNLATARISVFGSGNSDCNFTLKDKNSGLVFGDTGLVCLKFKNREHVLSVSKNALYTDNGKYVIRVKDGRKERVDVQVGAETGIYVEIVSGVEEGDVVMDE